MNNAYMSKETQEKRFQELIQKAKASGYTLEYDKQLDPNKRSSLWNYRYIAHLKINDDISIQLDVIGDVCGIVSGTSGVVIASLIIKLTDINFDLFIFSLQYESKKIKKLYDIYTDAT